MDDVKFAHNELCRRGRIVKVSHRTAERIFPSLFDLRAPTVTAMSLVVSSCFGTQCICTFIAVAFHLQLLMSSLSPSVGLLFVRLIRLFTARRYASAVFAVALCPTVRLSVRLPQVRFLPKDKRGIRQTTLHDSPGTFSF